MKIYKSYIISAIVVLITLLTACTTVPDSVSKQIQFTATPEVTSIPGTSVAPKVTSSPSASATLLPPTPITIPTETDTQLESIWYFYNQLDSSQKAAYMEIYSCLKAYIDNDAATEAFSCTLEDPGSTVNGQDIVMNMGFDNPVIAQYFVSYISVSKDNGNMVFRDVSTVDNQIFGDITDIRKQIGEIEAAADYFLSGINPSLSDYEKYLAIATKLCQEIEYDYSFGSPEQTAKDFLLDISVYGGLVNRLCVCQGFAKTYQYLCQRAGLFCMIVDGETSNGGHEWNIIKLEDGYYHVDTTWMQTKGNRYFCLTDAQIAIDHFIISQYHPECNGKQYAYDGE